MHTFSTRSSASASRAAEARLLNEYGPIESFPKDRLAAQRDQALLFKRLATLKTDAALFEDVDELRWRGPRPGFEKLVTKFDDPRLLARVQALAGKIDGTM